MRDWLQLEEDQAINAEVICSLDYNIKAYWEIGLALIGDMRNSCWKHMHNPSTIFVLLAKTLALNNSADLVTIDLHDHVNPVVSTPTFNHLHSPPQTGQTFLLQVLMT